MSDDPETNQALLARLCDPGDRDAWTEFVDIYQPVLLKIGRKFGLQAVDAENLTQDVFQKVMRKLPEWENGRPAGGIRRWLAVVTRNAAIDSLRRLQPDAPQGGTTVQQQLLNLEDRDDSLEQLFHDQVERQVFRQAAVRIRSEFADDTWVAFWATMVDGRPCAEVAAELDKSVGAIYTARSRVMQRLKSEVEQSDWRELEDSLQKENR